MFIEKSPTRIFGCYELQPRVITDPRGSFVKMFHRECFATLGLPTNWAEQYYSVSKKEVLRGIHFQLPPHDHAKLVYCTSGVVMDVAVDLRKGSPTFGQHVCITLSAAKANGVYLEKGLAHGFYTLSEHATLVYNVTSIYSSSHDAGIRWDSVGIPWPNLTPQLSERDKTFVSFDEFNSPFSFTSDNT